jgi:putative sterol carrier protein
VKNGEAVEAGKADSRNYDFELWASLYNWKRLATGEMGPKAALLTKRLKFKGSMITAMKYMSAFEESLKMMGNIPTDWDIK